MELLNELGIKRTKGLQLTLEREMLNSDLVSAIEKLCKEHEGKTPLYIRINHPAENVNVELLSRKFQIKPVDETIRSFYKLGGIKVSVV